MIGIPLKHPQQPPLSLLNPVSEVVCKAMLVPVVCCSLLEYCTCLVIVMIPEFSHYPYASKFFIGPEKCLS